MPIFDWFNAREQKRYTVSRPPEGGSRSAAGSWSKCEACKHILYEGELAGNLGVCPHCDYHTRLGAVERIAQIADEGSFCEIGGNLRSSDPLRFTSAGSYSERLKRAQEVSGLSEAVLTGRALIGGIPSIVGAMDFRFIAASMGSVVGERITRAFETAVSERRAVVMVVTSGGARMQEGVLSLMQMAKTAAAVRRLADAGLPYVSILTNPTLGGVTASFATLADVIIAEPDALIGFTGPRVIEQTIREKLPKGFQTSESLLDHGMIDAVVPREELKDRLASILGYIGAMADGGGPS